MTSLLFVPTWATDAATEEVTVAVDLGFLDTELGVVLLCLLDRVPLSAAFSATFLAFSSAFFLAASCLAFFSSAFFLAASSFSFFFHSLSLFLLSFSSSSFFSSHS